MTRLRGITWRHARGFDSVVGAAEAYRSVDGDMTIHWDARSLQAFADQPLEDLCRDYDLLVIDHPHMAHAGRTGLLTPLDDVGFDAELAELAAASVGPSHDSYRFEGRQLALAIDAAAQVSVRRADLLAEPPASWDEVLDLARDGRVLVPLTPVDAYSSVLTLAAAWGAPAFGASGVFLDHETGMRVLEFLIRIAELVPRECLAQNPIDVADRLSSEDRWAFAPLVFGYVNYTRPGFRARRLTYSDLPGGPPWRGSLLGGAGIAVSAASARREAAIRHAYWLASGDVQRGVYAESGGQPAHRAAWDDSRLDAETLGFFSGTRRTLEGAWMRPRQPRYLEFQDRVSRWVTATLAGERTPEDLLAAADAAAAELFDDGH